MILTHFDEQKFLKEYWQKKPCLIKNFYPNFVDPIDEDDLAGLAQEEDIDARVVTNIDGQWQVSQGPFSDFTDICKGPWSLLVQGVDRYIDELSCLSERVSFLPNWRFDDVMVSYSVTDAGVGAHIDEYDVFIIQGKGSRRWQVGLPEQATTKTFSPHPLLKLIKDFTAVIDEELSQGDAIYIPPKHPHKGQTLSPCLNYSLGFRAPTNLELLHGILDEGETLEECSTRYCDSNISDLRDTQDAAMLTLKEQNKLKESVLQILETEAGLDAILKYLSHQDLPDFALIEKLTCEEVRKLLQSGAKIVKSAGVKAVYPEQQSHEFCFYIDGQVFSINHALQAETRYLLANKAISASEPIELTSLKMIKGSLHTAWINLLTQLINAGYWEVKE